MRIESLNINQVESNQVHRYLNIFCNNTSMKQKLAPKPGVPQGFSKANKENSKEGTLPREEAGKGKDYLGGKAGPLSKL